MAHLFERLLALVGKSSGYPGRKRRRRRLAKLEQSGLFDRAWYLETYPDVRDSGVDPVRHYLESGWKEGRDPGPDFCTTVYLKTNSDVAAIGVNPLLHYIEHGKAEGRGTPHQTGPLRALIDPVVKFGPAAPCVQFPLPAFQVTPWARAGRIDDACAVEVGRVTISKANDASGRLMLEQALNRLAWLSGDVGSSWLEGPARAGTTLEIRDAWYAGQGIFRTRWNAKSAESVIVRALQQVGTEPELVGEARIGADLDFLDIRPPNRLFPLLFLFAKPDGELLGIRHLAFPGLCRGNPHYAELIALTQTEQTGRRGSISVDEQLASRMIALRSGGAAPLLTEMIVDLDGADGTRPLFQPYFRIWLARVLNIPVRTSGRSGGAPMEYLADAIAVEGPERTGVASLRLASDMIPTISVLSASGKPGTISEELAGSLIVASDDAAVASTLVKVPPGIPAADFSGSRAALATLTPCDRATGMSAQVPPLAIRLERRRPLSEVELLFPGAASKEVRTPQSISISWLISPQDWAETDLAQALEALLQQKSSVSSIAFVGEPSASTRQIADRLFDGRVAVAPDSTAAAAMIETSLCGYLGPSVVLHDRHTVERLAPVLDLPEALTATALVVSAERRGKGTVVCPADSGNVRDARLLPGAIVPIGGAPRDFWISRANVVTTWRRSGTATQATGRHLCSTLVAVSKLAPGDAAELPFTLPFTPKNRTISTELVIG